MRGTTRTQAWARAFGARSGVPVLLLLALVFFLQDVSAKKTPEQVALGETPSALPCDCTDIAPRDSFLRANVSFNCWEQANFVPNPCDMPFMTDAIDEVPEGYCQISCGKCGCCPTLDNVLENKSLNMFRWVLSFSEIGAYTKLPGYMATLLAPNDGAIWDALNRLGYKDKAAVEADGNARNILADIGRYHVLPPVNPLQAVWTTPFMRRGVQMYTALQDKSISAEKQDGKVKLTSPKSSAWTYEQDIYACKGYVDIIDAVLVPWSMQGYP